ncbi:MAG: hypothetical protein IJS88_00010 [Alphaproteobacteria bacterium]|nr:hypothetical protein [Alphaproteobacteria bacterium]
MELRRCSRQIFLFILTLGMLWTTSVFAATHDCPSDKLTDDNKKDIANQALTSLQESKVFYQQYTKDFNAVFNDGNGACHYLNGSLQINLNNTAQMIKEDAVKKMNYGNNAPKGIEAGDKLLEGNNLSSLYGSFVSTDNSLEGTDVNISRLIKRANSGVAGVRALLNWAQNPANQAEGTTMAVDAEASELLETIYNYKLDCKEAVMIGGGKFKCIQGVLPTAQELANDLENLSLSEVSALVSSGGTIAGIPVPALSGPAAIAATAAISSVGLLGAATSGVMVKVAEMFLQNAGALTAFTDSASGFAGKVQNLINSNKCIETLEDLNTTRNKLGQTVKDAGSKLAILSGDAEVTCQCDDTTNEVVSCEAIDDSIIQDGLDALKECKTVADYEQQLTEKCYACELFSTILGAAQKISKNAFDTTSGALTTLVVIGFLLYIAYKTLLTIASPEAQKISKYLTDLLLQGTKVAITIFILQNPSFLYSKLLSPILESSVEFGMSLTGTSAVKAAETGKKYSQGLDDNNEYFSTHTAQMMVGAVENFTNGATTIPAIGRSFICHSWTDLGFRNLYVIPRLSMFGEGIVLLIAGLGIWLSISFYMVDCAIELGIVCALMSFFVACWPFKLTTGYTKIGWNMFLNVFFNFVMMGVIITTVVGLSTQALSVGMPQEELINLINSDSVPAIEAAIPLGGIQFLVVLVCCAMCFKLPEQAGRLASKFAGGAQLGTLGAHIGQLAAGMITSATVGDKFGKQGKLGGLAGLAVRGGKAWGKSVGEHTGATGALNAKLNNAKSTINNIKGHLGLGSNAKMGAKGRNQMANNQQDEITNGFNQDK